MNQQPSDPNIRPPTSTSPPPRVPESKEAGSWFDPDKLQSSIASMKQVREQRLAIVEARLRDAVVRQLGGAFEYEDIAGDPENSEIIRSIREKMYKKYVKLIDDQIDALNCFLRVN